MFLQTLVDTKYRSIEEIDDTLGLGSQQMPNLS